MRLSLPKPQAFFLRSNSTASTPNSNSKWLLLSRSISCPNHLDQFLSHAIVTGLLQSSHLYIWNSLLHSLARGPSPDLSISLFDFIRREGIAPDNYTFTAALKAIARLSLPRSGEEIHSLSLKLGFESDTFVQNSLIHVYSASGSVGTARKVFDLASASVVDVVSWNSMISGYLQGNLCEEALGVFGRMVEKSIRMDKITAVSSLIACGRIGALDLGRRIHALVVVNGFVMDFYLCSSLVCMYAKCGLVGHARKLFDGMPDRNVVCWTSMISGYAQSGRFREAVELFREMQVAGVRADDATVASVVSSCAQLGALDQGKYIHAYCDANGIGQDISVKNAWIDMYSKCGDIKKALQIFWGLVRRDIFSWTAMISGLAMNGYSSEALDLFSQMEDMSEVLPNEVTFLGVLSACSHGGLVEKGFHYFEHMIRAYKLTPKIEHYGCMVDLLGRAKLLVEVKKFIEEMPVEPDVVIWRSLLFACRINGHVKLAEYAAERIMELEPKKCGGHVLLSNVYAVASRWSDVNRVRRVMYVQSIQKQPGCSFIEINGNVHEFFAKDTSHPETEVIHGVLLWINKHLLSETYTIHSPGSFYNSTQKDNELNQRQEVRLYDP
ncbi:pentatricopeptide repeat-containing protein At1g31430 [Elaeis guineensis]|uniref:Pentatricopeptide repeat-containing protein At1g31430 n=1 Tax=Elaeis guineensis var. tenera TaxID=51953 RepID=A0A6I9QNC0_ELAGV|nr:pentatricopeptide repeat-containing protein At1g31430 [Elaeis guineensis]